MSVEPVDAVVIGAGVVGLAVARALAMAGREVLILEAGTAFGTGTSSRNSEVLHAGLYYPTGSLKARCCVQGRRELVDYARSRGVLHALCGKLVVATSEAEVPAIEKLAAQAQANGVEGVHLLTGEQARALEPELHAVAALHSTATGIIDSHALMTALLGDAQRHGAQLALRSPVVGGSVLADGSVELEVGVAADAVNVGVALPDRMGLQDRMRLHAQTVVNAAGLHAPAVARRVQGLPAEQVPWAWFCKGHYFSLAGRSPFSRLVYPVHTAAGLGTHLTLDLAGQARFGPDVEWLEGVGEGAVEGTAADEDAGTGALFDYRVDTTRAAAFERDIRRYWPALPEGALVPAYSGIRPKIVGPGEPAADFRLSTPAEHGIRGWVGMYGIESPGLTACMALGREVVAAVGD